MKKMVIEIKRSDIPSLMNGLVDFAKEYDDGERYNGYVELQFIQSPEYLLILKMDRKEQLNAN